MLQLSVALVTALVFLAVLDGTHLANMVCISDTNVVTAVLATNIVVTAVFAVTTRQRSDFIYKEHKDIKFSST